MEAAYPPPPWRMCGPAVIVAGPIPAGTARELSPPGTKPLIVGGRGIGVVLVADYRTPSTLRYGEAAGLVAVQAGRRLGGFVDTMWVDLRASRQGGHEIWNVPKELATFTWEGDPPHAVHVADPAGGTIVSARFAPVPRAAVPVRARSTFFGARAGALKGGSLRGGGALLPRRVELEIPATSPLARLNLGRPRLGLAGRVDVDAGLAG